NYMGDTTFLSGEITDKRVDPSGQTVVDVRMRMVNQRDTETAYGMATVALPSKDRGLPIYPAVPDAIRQEAARMFARHNELSAAKRGR
ncbi:MAG: acyl dehydratase, partial [Actinomycetota bacterium]|nr:acyl dehydratase [Actinomycetota bacterium]